MHLSSYPPGKCTGYGSRYTTFDGKSYTFNESCSYYLVKEIIDEHNLTIIVNKQDCDPLDSTFCPQSLTVLYGSYKVVLTQLRTSGKAANVVSNHSNCQQYLLFWYILVSVYCLYCFFRIVT